MTTSGNSGRYRVNFGCTRNPGSVAPKPTSGGRDQGGMGGNPQRGNCPELGSAVSQLPRPGSPALNPRGPREGAGHVHVEDHKHRHVEHDGGWTLAQAGAVIGATRERARQIETSAMAKLRLPVALALGRMAGDVGDVWEGDPSTTWDDLGDG